MRYIDHMGKDTTSRAKRFHKARESTATYSATQLNSIDPGHTESSVTEPATTLKAGRNKEPIKDAA
jgi:hypothetical protein